MEIRTIEADEMPTFWQLWVRGLREHPDAFGASYEWAKGVSAEQSREILQHIQSGGGFILGAFEGSEAVGMLNFNRQQGEKFQHKGDVGAIYVVPEHRGKGIGKALLDEALNRGRAIAGLVTIALSVNKDNAPAIRVYETCGFKVYGVEPKGLYVDGEYIDLLHMTFEV